MNDDLEQEANIDTVISRRLLAEHFQALSVDVIDASESTTTEEDDDNTTTIIIAVVLVVVGLLIVIGFVCYMKKKKGNDNGTRTHKAVEMGGNGGDTLIAGGSSRPGHVAKARSQDEGDEAVTLV
eukprot:CAMPEP_0201588960 /NCGR_PEP_ID=MMETSP0190_2-20130828/161182_1 /ASSEMBLY_ACC=CAM_ASM_000263 /TAXON_ID=37353 /ORGANISM="Rosalina sp." /LENGTH=124 /DNA_ID=CAMNT_0048042149 /DNA_START=120 /DNA_END=494 /DNA_ORIENTATION=+